MHTSNLLLHGSQESLGIEETCQPVLWGAVILQPIIELLITIY